MTPLMLFATRGCELAVWRTDHYVARLTITDRGALVVDEPVSLYYGAPFGPDVSDVNAWMERLDDYLRCRA